MTGNDDAESRRRAVLAAVLAVKRGFISPDDAMSMLDGVMDAPPAPVHTPAPAAAVPAATAPASPDDFGTVLAINPGADVGTLTVELDALMQQGGSALQGLGLSEQQAESLLSLRPGASDAKTRARAALTDVARGRLEELRAQLPVSGAGRYAIKREFARGGMGRILVAVDTAVGREVALKEVLGPHEGSSGARSDPNPQAVERFVREAKVTGQLEHPNIVPVYEICRRDDGSIFYTMKLVRGRSLAEKLAEIRHSGRPDTDKRSMRLQLIESFLAVCHAIAYAHSRGVIHRDLKPQNIMLGSFGETVVLDWGLARVGNEESTAGPARVSPSLVRNGRDSHTVDGTVIGTPAYMPPEQARGQLELVDEKSDVYSLGAILYELLSGRPPFEGMGADSILEKVVNGRPEPLAQASPGAPPDLVRLCERAMERERSVRLPSAEALAREVQAFRDGRNLSVYDYSSLELARRFVARNRAATLVSALAAMALVAVISFSIYNVARERDAARDALARADAEQAEREALQARQKRERAQLVLQRQEAVAGAVSRLAALEPKESDRQARELLHSLLARTPEQRRYYGPRPEASQACARLLAIANARRELHRLATEPVAGVAENLLPQNELAALADALLEDRLLAVMLASLNDDFAMAELILDGTDGPEQRLADARYSLLQARQALQRKRAARINEILGFIRRGKDDSGVSVNADQVRLYVAEVGPWREEQTAQMLIAALADVCSTAGEWVVLDARRRLEIEFASEVLLLAAAPAQAVPALAELMLALSDEEVTIRIAITLCKMGHEAAFDPLLKLLAKHGVESLVWVRVRRHVGRVPAPSNLVEPEYFDGLTLLARLHLEQGNRVAASALARKAIALQPDKEEPRMIFAQSAHSIFNDMPNTVIARNLDQQLAERPNFARALSLRARLIHVVPGPETWESRNARALEMHDRAVALAPKDWMTWRSRAQHRALPATRAARDPIDPHGAMKDFETAISLMPRIPDTYRELAGVQRLLGLNREAMASVNKALDLDPDSAANWQLRAALHASLEDWGAAIRDNTRAIDLAPDQMVSLINRAGARLQQGDARGALVDANAVYALEGEGLPPLFTLRADIHEALGNYEAAIADLELYLKLRPKDPDADEFRAQIERLKGLRK